VKVLPSSSSTVRVRYAETDKMGVVYYANYFVWFEVARADLLRSLGWSYRDMEHAGITLPVIEAQCEYVRPARYDDELEIRAEGRMLSPVRMEFTYQVHVISSGADPSLAASGRTVHAALDANGRPCRLPPRIREVFA
jgi:acyl-CoA thioester hydrolase